MVNYLESALMITLSTLSKIASVMQHFMSKGSHLLLVFHFKAFMFRQEGLGPYLAVF